jgi:DhnA family fructose-bisphosphate aldolase class Ia
MYSVDLSPVRETRARHPEAVVAAAVTRRRRPLLDDSGQLLLIAVDHPARNALGVRESPMAMQSRADLLGRVVAALGRPGVDGVLGSPDIIEDLLVLGALDDKVVVGSMNRGGLQGAVFEFDDRFTGYDAPAISRMGYNGGKVLTRVALDDPGTVGTLAACAQAVTDLAELGLMAMIEPFSSSWVDGRPVNDLSPEGVIRSVSVCSALGATSAYSWLKLPVTDDMERVMAATTLPTLLLGGDPTGRPDQTYARWEKALSAPGVRGLVVGRALLYPPGDDVEATVDIAAGLVRDSVGTVLSRR